jgi:hypothetical protein
MDFLDEDVSASGDELERDENGNMEYEQYCSDEAGSGCEEAGDEQMHQAPAAAAAAAGSKPVAGRQEVKAAQDALLGGEISTNAALLQLQVCSCC